MKSVIPADFISFCELDHARRIEVTCSDCSAQPAEDPGTPLPPEFWDICWNSPLSVHRRRTGERGPIKLSDLLTRRELHRHAVYADWYRDWEIEDELIVDLRDSTIHTRKFLFDSTGRDFSERDRRVASLFQPHLATAYRNAAKRRLVAGALAATEAANEPIVLLGPGGEAEYFSPAAHDLIEAYFGSNGRLPAALADWHRSGASAPFVASSNGRRLIVELAGRPDTLILREEQDSPAAPLTPRERDVVLLAATGKTNKQIAQDLWVTPATVKKHLEHVYEKLGVQSRTAAAAKLGLLPAG